MTPASSGTTIIGLRLTIPALLWIAASYAAAAPQPAATPTLDQLLARAGAYVDDYQVKQSGIVAEERYVQTVTSPPPRTIGSDTVRRTLLSDLLLVKPHGGDRWLQFRDVYEVDGRPVRDRSERLFRLFLDPDAATAQQADRIVAESARYNIGGAVRNVNIPVLALLILDPSNQRRFAFRLTDERKPRLIGEPKLAGAGDVRTVAFDESRHGTLIRTSNDRDLFARGRFWIETATGRVVATEISIDDEPMKATLNVVYQPEPALDCLVPAEMRELYDLHDGSRVEATAKYSRFRQFQVKVDEKIAPIK